MSRQAESAGVSRLKLTFAWFDGSAKLVAKEITYVTLILASGVFLKWMSGWAEGPSFIAYTVLEYVSCTVFAVIGVVAVVSHGVERVLKSLQRILSSVREFKRTLKSGDSASQPP